MNTWLQKFSLLLILYGALIVHGALNICYHKKKNSSEAVNFDIFSTQDKRDLVEILHEDLHNGTLLYEHVDVNFTHPALSLAGTFDNLTVSHLNLNKESENFNIDFRNNSQFSFYNVTVYNISLEGLYNIKGNVGDLFDIYGNGYFWLNIYNFTVETFSSVYENATDICVPSDITVLIDSCDCWFHNFMDGPEMEDLLNRAIKSILPEIIEVMWEEFLAKRGHQLEDWINKKINK